ncbi:helix-turn-helix domain-containing protein [Microcoleus sp. BR0-C5]|uniref:helix-turn-helix domain-containing protein n=1 Tax=Microcoleus sp. BR0-C5 TaxID=2818713 RepID=UPI004040ACE8
MPFFLLILGSDCTHFFHFSAAKAIVSLLKNCPEYCLKEFIDSRGLTVYQFWKQAGITQSAGYRLYHNRDVLPLKRVLDKICTAYQIQPWEF